MADQNLSPEFLQETKNLIEGVISKPKPNDKLLQKPPFKFIYDIVINIISTTGFAKDLFTSDELDQEKAASSKESKINFLEKIIKYVSEQTGQQIQAKPAKIVAGHEPELTNIFFQYLAKSAKNFSSNNDNSTKKKPKKSSEAPIENESAPSEEKRKKKKKKISEETEEKPKKKSEDKIEEKPKKKKISEEGTEEKPKKKKSEDGSEKKKKKKEGEEGKAKKKKTTTEKKGKEKKAKAKDLEIGESQIPTKITQNFEPTNNNKTLNILEESEFNPRNLERPKTAAKPPPRLKDSANTVEKISVDTSVSSVVNTNILVEGQQEEEELNQAIVEPEEKTNESSSNQQQPIDIGSISQEEHGALVRDILETNKTLNQTGDGQTTKKDTVRVEILANKHQKEVLQKEVSKLRDQIQIVCRSANPLGKIMDYIQEDFDNMNKELEKWKTETVSQQMRLKEEQRLTETSVAPINQKLIDLDQSFASVMQKIHVIKNSISKNDETISKMLALVIN